MPAAIRFTTTIPRTGSGKVKRFELARLLDDPVPEPPDAHPIRSGRPRAAPTV